MISCCKFTYQDLRNWADKAHHKIVKEEWCQAEAEAYLKYCCFSTKTIASIIECASNVLKGIQVQREDDEEGVEAWDALHENEPSKYEKWKPPACWNSGLEVQQSVEPSMHQLFLGLVDTVMGEVQSWCSLRRKFESMKAAVDKRNRLIMELHLSWCKTQPYTTDKLGGWISENFLGFARIMPWP